MQHKNLFHTSLLMKQGFLLVLAVLIGNLALAQDESVDSIKIDTTFAPPVQETVLPEFDRVAAFDTTRFQSYSLADSVVNNIKKDEAFWYANYSPENKKAQEEKTQRSNPFFLKPWFRTLLWIVIVGGFIAVLIWFLMASDVRLFRKKPGVVDNVSDSVLPDDIFSIHYENEIQAAAANKNFRLGVRLMYLHVLTLLSKKDLIEYKIEKTNSDYLEQLYSTAYYKDFFLLTRHFEYVWYGQFDLSEIGFSAIEKEYADLKNRLLS